MGDFLFAIKSSSGSVLYTTDWHTPNIDDISAGRISPLTMVETLNGKQIPLFKYLGTATDKRQLGQFTLTWEPVLDDLDALCENLQSTRTLIYIGMTPEWLQFIPQVDPDTGEVTIPFGYYIKDGVMMWKVLDDDYAGPEDTNIGYFLNTTNDPPAVVVYNYTTHLPTGVYSGGSFDVLNTLMLPLIWRKPHTGTPAWIYTTESGVVNYRMCYIMKTVPTYKNGLKSLVVTCQEVQ